MSTWVGASRCQVQKTLVNKRLPTWMGGAGQTALYALLHSLRDFSDKEEPEVKYIIFSINPYQPYQKSHFSQDGYFRRW